MTQDPEMNFRRQMVELELAAGIPTTQEAFCALGARISIQMGARPTTEDGILACSHAGAMGLFGEAFEAADDEQRAVWVEMYERALRDEMLRLAQ